MSQVKHYIVDQSAWSSLADKDPGSFYFVVDNLQSPNSSTTAKLYIGSKLIGEGVSFSDIGYTDISVLTSASQTIHLNSDIRNYIGNYVYLSSSLIMETIDRYIPYGVDVRIIEVDAQIGMRRVSGTWTDDIGGNIPTYEVLEIGLAHGSSEGYDITFEGGLISGQDLTVSLPGGGNVSYINFISDRDFTLEELFSEPYLQGGVIAVGETVSCLQSDGTTKASRFTGDGWNGDLHKIVPGHAYMFSSVIRTTDGRTITYPEIGSSEESAVVVTRIEEDQTNEHQINVYRRLIDLGGGDTDGDIMVNYADLVTLRNNGELKQGSSYRITDYTCTTTQTNTQSAGHLFDIIVTADSETELNENARAAHHSGDTYFQNCDLSSWELKYCIDNDTDRFAWADTTNGKGVIYYMKDELENECPYDFKNIQFKRWAVTSVTSNTMNQETLESLNRTFVFDGDTTKFQVHFGYKSSNCIYGTTTHVVNPNNTGWYYTFSIILYDVVSSEYSLNDIEDGSIKGNNYYNDEGGGGFYGNTIKPRYDNMASDHDGIDGAQVLNNIVLNGYYENGDDTYIYGCNNNSFGGNCYNSTFGNQFYNNSFGNDCSLNTFGNFYNSNSFGDGCYSNSFGNGCRSNSFGDDCISNSLGNNCQYNTFGNDCISNSFCNTCQHNSLGNNCKQNSFCNTCQHNSLGNYCQHNSLGNNCRQNSFGNNCWQNLFEDYCQNITIFDGVWNCNVTGGTNSSPIKNAQILNGTKGTSSSNRLTITFEPNKDYTQVAGLVNGTDLRIWIAEDTVTGPVSSIDSNIAVFDGTTGKAIKDGGMSISDIMSGSVAEDILYSDLVTLVSGGNLVTGKSYRITDYSCTTTQANTTSASNVFDIIVIADSETELNESARASHHSGDTYFQKCDLSSWEIKYCLDNDTSRFSWADTTNGKGVIYYMKDEWNNECPYDFKNIQFYRKLDSYGRYSDSGVSTPVYTFNVGSTGDITVTAHTSSTMSCHDNTVCNYFGGSHSDSTILNDNVFLFANQSRDCYNNYIGTNSYSNTFGNGCHDNTFYGNAYNNIFAPQLVNNIVGYEFHDNTTTSSFQHNRIGNQVHHLTAGSVIDSEIGSVVFYVEIGNNVYDLVIGNNVTYVTIGGYIYHLRLNPQTSMLEIPGGTSSNYLRNSTVLQGTKGTSSDSRLSIVFEKNKYYEQVAGLDSGGNLRIWKTSDDVVNDSGVASVTGNVPVFSDTSGKKISDSGFSIGASVPQDADFRNTARLAVDNLNGEKKIYAKESPDNYISFSSKESGIRLMDVSNNDFIVRLIWEEL